ncbi:helix-turn-helix domain-containing protein [Clostridium sp.]|uniref:helix-turn-helix domain-containing protein n=1 Tax=Clostridium sp. TaxID=1506 RepID=UPI0029088208|nr:helix-turn-helix domain-containing protein [Clostridium sp.]MDU4739469.1 helix-turn-helix domain-containing protein [Clostridium sp.]MDU7364456.1 helix-turn-helix domain-containing protein [Clostridium sp.]
MKCYICDHDMEEKIISINTGWGDYKLTVNGVNAYVCPECGEMVLDSKDATMLQKLSRSFEETEAESKPDILNLTEVADLLRVSNQTIYNMIKDGRIKAVKFGREWRFNRKDIDAYINGSYDIAARNKKGEIDSRVAEAIEKYK